jgi:hypothetical protein
MQKNTSKDVPKMLSLTKDMDGALEAQRMVCGAVNSLITPIQK